LNLLTFTYLILTLKQASRMHHSQTKNEKFSPQILPNGEGGYPFLRPYLPQHDYRAFGTQRSRLFSFTTRTLGLR